MLRLIASSPYKLEPDRLRLLDFYLLFPHLLKKVHLPSDLTRRRGQVAGSSNHYRFNGQPQLVFRTITPVHDAALNLLSTSAWTRLEDDRVYLNASALPDEVRLLLVERNAEQNDLISFLVADLYTVPLCGHDGLKQRTGLMEYRYDAI